MINKRVYTISDFTVSLCFYFVSNRRVKFFFVGAAVIRKQTVSCRRVNQIEMPDYTNTSYYYGKFSDISQTSLKNMPYCDESFSDLLSQCSASLSSLNLHTLREGTQNQLYPQQYETHQKKLYRQLQRSHTSCTDTEKPNWQDLKCAVPVPKHVKLGRQGERYITEEPKDGSSTSKSSSSCDRSGSRHSSRTSNKHSRKNSKGPSSGDTNSATSKSQTAGHKAQKKSGKLLEPQAKDATSSARKGRPREDESYRQQHEPLTSESPHLHVSSATGANKRHSVKPIAPVAELPHDRVGSRLVPDRNGTRNSGLSAKTEVGDTADYQIDASKYDDTARLEIFKLRNRIKRYTEGTENPMLRKYHLARAQTLNSPAGKTLMPKSQTTPDCRSGYQSLPSPRSPVPCTKHPPLIQKSLPQMLHVTPVKKKRRNFEICDQLPEKQIHTARCTSPPRISSAVSDGRSRESSRNVSNRTEPCVRDRTIQSPTHIGTKRTLYQKENGSAKSVPQHTPAKSQMDTAEQYRGNSQLQPQPLKRNQLRRPVPGQRPLYNYDQLPYQASEVYPDLICELEEKLLAINSQHSSGKTLSPLSK